MSVSLILRGVASVSSLVVVKSIVVAPFPPVVPVVLVGASPLRAVSVAVVISPEVVLAAVLIKSILGLGLGSIPWNSSKRIIIIKGSVRITVIVVGKVAVVVIKLLRGVVLVGVLEFVLVVLVVIVVIIVWTVLGPILP